MPSTRSSEAKFPVAGYKMKNKRKDEDRNIDLFCRTDGPLMTATAEES
jgi:hypothetical protein